MSETASRPSRVGMISLGCAKNLVDSEVMLGELARRGYEVVGVDHSRSGIAIAKKRFPALRFEQHDLAAPLPAGHHGRYDCVVSSEVIEHMLLPRCLMAAARAALRPGGVLILTTPYHGYWKNLALALTGRFDEHWHPLRDHGHVKFFSRRTLLRLFEEFGFGELRYLAVGRIPPLARSMIVAGTKPQ